jgi:anti-sigma factor RsiW
MIRLTIRSRRELVCQQAVELVTDYLEGALSSAQRRRFEAHLASCVDCPEYLAQMRAIVALAGTITPDDLSPRMRGEIVRLYLRWRADEAQDPQG